MRRTESTASIRAIGEAAGLPPDLTDFAVNIYEQAVDAGFQPSGPRCYGGAVYGAARIRDYPIKPKTVAAAVDDVGVEADDVVRSMNRLVAALPFDVDLEDPSSYIRRYVDGLGGTPQLLESAIDLCDEATAAGVNSGKSPSGFAAACVYAASYMLAAPYTQDDVADEANVSTVTIRNMYRDIIRVHGDVEPRIAADGGEAVTRAVEDVFKHFDDVPDFVRSKALEMVDDLDGADWLRNKNPNGVAAGALYVAAKQNRVDLSQSELADVAGVHKETVLSRVKDIRGHFDGGD